MIWETLINLQLHIEESLEATGEQTLEPGMTRFNKPGWVNRVWTSEHYRRAHVDVVDARDSKKLWMMHVCIMPHLDDDGPIFGFDVIAGKNKITGAFFDFSVTTNPHHHLVNMFANVTPSYGFTKERVLPDWAKEIFSPYMIAAGNVSTEKEIELIDEMVRDGLHTYLSEIGRVCLEDPKKQAEAQNRYAYWQKQNPHTPRTMSALGLDEEDVRVFIEDCLFPEVEA